MKKIYILIVSLWMGSMATVSAQTLYDANHLIGSDLNGTARFVGMGGAMGALGGDISTTSTNPAGIGLYRANDAMVTFGLQNWTVKSDFDRYSNKQDRTRATFDNIGVVFSNRINNTSSLRFVNFAINYHRSNSFNRDMLMSGSYASSLTTQIATMVNNMGITPNELSDDGAYLNSNIPWLGVLAYNAYLINPDSTTTGGTKSFSGFSPYYLFDNGGFVNGTYHSRERGGIDNMDFNLAFNISDRFYLGATLGIYDIDYKKDSHYTERFWANTSDTKDDGNYTLNNYYNVDGSGVDLKLGFIVRPVESSPFRFGMAVHTPTYYYLTEHQIAYLDFDTYDISSGKFKQSTSSPYDENGNDMESETKYRILTPWKFNFSLGYTVGNYAAFGAEYEYADYSSAKMEDNDGNRMDYETNTIENMLKGVHTFRFGAEFKVVPEMSIRLGYNFISSSTKDNASKVLANNAVRTDAEYLNTKNINNLTFGLGFHSGAFYADMAYIYSNRKSNFYPFNASNIASTTNDKVKTKVTDENNHVLFTLGYRF